MKNDSFFNSTFDSGTKSKLNVFARVYREWISLFLTKNKTNFQPQVYIYDFFAGQGMDKDGNPGSPLLLLREIKQYCETNKAVRANEIHPNILFNDSDSNNIELLKKAVEKEKCPNSCFNIRYTSKKFHDALKDELPTMKKSDSACLVVMDQFGVSEVTEDVIKMLDMCPRTDFMFFISSSFIKRFQKQECIRSILNIEECPHHEVHRKVCEAYKNYLPPGSSTFLAPFSIKKEKGNIYGIIFGSHHLLGLEKFLRVCWEIDDITGEANFDIDNDGVARYGQLDLFDNATTKKKDKFESDILGFIQKGKDNKLPVNNRDIYLFTLKNGFLPKHANEIIKKNKDSIVFMDNHLNIVEKPRGYYLQNKYLDDSHHFLYFSWNPNK